MSAQDSRTADDPGADDETDAEQLESEWHVWLWAMLVVVGGAAFLAPDYLVPDILASIAPLFVALGVLGWIAMRIIG